MTGVATCQVWTWLFQDCPCHFSEVLEEKKELVLKVMLPVKQGFERTLRLQRGSETRSLRILAFALDQRGGPGEENPGLIALGK